MQATAVPWKVLVGQLTRRRSLSRPTSADLLEARLLVKSGYTMAYVVSLTSAFVDPGTNTLQFIMHDPGTNEHVTVLVGSDAVRKLGGSDDPLRTLERYHTELAASAAAKIDTEGLARVVYLEISDLGESSDAVTSDVSKPLYPSRFG